MTQSRYELALSATVIEAARTAVGEHCRATFLLCRSCPPKSGN